MPHVRKFELDSSVVAGRIYRNYEHQTTSMGLVIEKVIRRELSSFLSTFLAFVQCEEHVFLRLDAFATTSELYIIEVNVELQDGWGVALNLLRASNNKLETDGVRLPTEIILYRDDYRPEFELAQNELAWLGHNMEIVSWRSRPGVLAKGAFDSKIHLARFSQTWLDRNVRIPKTYIAETTPWNSIPEDVVFKFCEKYGEQARKALYSVARRREIGHGKFMRKCYENGTAIAQELVTPFKLEDGSSTQAIILCSRNTPVVGYTQVAPPSVFVINDKSASKGPLIFE